jgi:hypothetical protein
MGVNNVSAIAMGDGGDSAMDYRMMAQLQWAMVAGTRGDATTSQVKCEGGPMRGKVQPANALGGGVATRGDSTTSRGKYEGDVMRGKVTTSRRIERQWRQQGDATTSQPRQTRGWHIERQRDNQLAH